MHQQNRHVVKQRKKGEGRERETKRVRDARQKKTNQPT